MTIVLYHSDVLRADGEIHAGFISYYFPFRIAVSFLIAFLSAIWRVALIRHLYNDL